MQWRRDHYDKTGEWLTIAGETVDDVRSYLDAIVPRVKAGEPIETMPDLTTFLRQRQQAVPA